MGNQYFKISELEAHISERYEKGVSKGMETGFSALDSLYSIKLGCTTYVYGSPACGKSEFWFEMMINLSKKYGWKHAIYSPETGTPTDIAIELIHKWAGRPFYDNLDRKAKSYKLSKKEILEISKEVNEFFYIVDAGEYDFTIPQFYDKVDEIAKENNIVIHTTMADPFNEFKHDLLGEARDMYLESVLGRIRRNARNTNRHNCVITHVVDQQLQQTKGIDGQDVFYYPLATPRQVSGGQAYFRKGDAMICLWRPPYGCLEPSTNRVYDGNEVMVAIQKAKPKGIGKTGRTTLWFDSERSRYYELINNIKSYSFEYNKNKHSILDQINVPF
jgi:hypothetical protein